MSEEDFIAVEVGKNGKATCDEQDVSTPHKLLLSDRSKPSCRGREYNDEIDEIIDDGDKRLYKNNEVQKRINKRSASV